VMYRNERWNFLKWDTKKIGNELLWAGIDPRLRR